MKTMGMTADGKRIMVMDAEDDALLEQAKVNIQKLTELGAMIDSLKTAFGEAVKIMEPVNRKKRGPNKPLRQVDRDESDDSHPEPEESVAGDESDQRIREIVGALFKQNPGTKFTVDAIMAAIKRGYENKGKTLPCAEKAYLSKLTGALTILKDREMSIESVSKGVYKYRA